MSDDIRKKAFDFASDTTKQLITLSTALIAISITFKGDFGKGDNETILLLCWISFFLSVLFGIWTLSALTGTLEKSTEASSEDNVKLSIYGTNVKRPTILQIIFFLLGLILLGTYGTQSIYSDNKMSSSEEIKIIKECTYKFIEPNKVDTLEIEKKK